MNYNFETFIFTDDNIEEANEWLVEYGWPVGIDQSWVPEDTGYLAVLDGVNMASLFLYITNSKTAILGYPIANPFVSRDLSRAGVGYLIEKTISIAKEDGCERIITYMGNKSMTERYLDHGFVVGDKGVTNLVRSL